MSVQRKWKFWFSIFLFAFCNLYVRGLDTWKKGDTEKCQRKIGCMTFSVENPPCGYGMVKPGWRSYELMVSVVDCDGTRLLSASTSWYSHTPSGRSAIRQCRNKLSCDVGLPSKSLAALMARKLSLFSVQVFRPTRPEIEEVSIVLHLQPPGNQQKGSGALSKRIQSITGLSHVSPTQPAFSPHRRGRRQKISKRQGSNYDETLENLENLVMQEEQNSADTSAMAGRFGTGWSNWSPWSTCSVSCGTVGEKTRQRDCKNDPISGVACDGSNADSETCSPATLKCPETDSWGSWSEWGECSRTCGDGLRSRERSCVVSNPSLSCHGDSAQTQPCNLQSCQLKESWTDWSEWSRCSVSCGEGHKSRERVCKDDKTGVETSNCPGSKRNSQVCDQPLCSSGVRVKTVHAVEGHSATLKCLYNRMTPPVVIYWLTPDQKRINHQSHDSSYEAIGDSLFIRHSTGNMVGLFRCVVHDSKGKVLMGEAPVDVVDCTSLPCRNGGLCQEIQAVDHFNSRYTTFRCLCGTGYNGLRCEGGLGPGNIVALFLILLLAVIALSGICMVFRFREAENPPKKLIGTRGSKLIVVTSRDALAVSCDESSSDASVSDSPIRQFDLEDQVHDHPNLKTSKGIGSIFPKWGWNNNNSLRQFQFGPKNKNNHRYAAVNTSDVDRNSKNDHRYSPLHTSDVSRSNSETTTISTQRSESNEDKDKSYNCKELSGSGGESRSASSDTGVGEDATETDSNSASTSSSSGDTTCSSVSSDHRTTSSHRKRSKAQNTTKVISKKYCQSISNASTRSATTTENSAQSFTTRTGTTLTNTSGDSTLCPLTISSRSSQRSTTNHWQNQNSSCHANLSDTPKRLSSCKNPMSKSCLFGNSSLPGQTNYSVLQETGFERQFDTIPDENRQALYNPANISLRRRPIMLDNHNSVTQPADYPLPGYERDCQQPTQRLMQMDKKANTNHSCTLETDTNVIPALDRLDLVSDGLNNSRLDLHQQTWMEILDDPEIVLEPNFAAMLNRLRVQLNKEREKACAKVRCLTSIVSEPTNSQPEPIIGSSNMPAYGNVFSHATSTPTNESSVNGPPPKTNLTFVSTAAPSEDERKSNSGNISLVFRPSPDSPTRQQDLNTDPPRTQISSGNSPPSRSSFKIPSPQQTDVNNSQDWQQDVETIPLLKWKE